MQKSKPNKNMNQDFQMFKINLNTLYLCNIQYTYMHAHIYRGAHFDWYFGLAMFNPPFAKPKKKLGPARKWI